MVFIVKYLHQLTRLFAKEENLIEITILTLFKLLKLLVKEVTADETRG